MVSATLGLFVYLPAGLVLSTLAWPGFSEQDQRSGYLVNRLAYSQTAPIQGDWVWASSRQGLGPFAGRVIATAGQEVEWTGRKWQIDGRPCQMRNAPRLTAWPQPCRFQVPVDHVLVEPDDTTALSASIGPVVLVPSDAIVGRAWARLYPMWDRCLL
jgi:hypothetical protein